MKSPTKQILFLTSIIIVIILIFLTITKQSTNRQFKKNLENSKREKPKIEEVRKYSLKEIGKHNKKEDCWLLIKGKVYDVTKFIALGQHPPVIEMGCGKDATTLFETRTTETGKKIGSGKPHSQKAKELLQDYYLGELTNK